MKVTKTKLTCCFSFKNLLLIGISFWWAIWCAALFHLDISEGTSFLLQNDWSTRLHILSGLCCFWLPEGRDELANMLIGEFTVLPDNKNTLFQMKRDCNCCKPDKTMKIVHKPSLFNRFVLLIAPPIWNHTFKTVFCFGPRTERNQHMQFGTIKGCLGKISLIQLFCHMPKCFETKITHYFLKISNPQTDHWGSFT